MHLFVKIADTLASPLTSWEESVSVRQSLGATVLSGLSTWLSAKESCPAGVVGLTPVWGRCPEKELAACFSLLGIPWQRSLAGYSQWGGEE